jgi:putative tryptophan/tyrosine transport system substrate-binding protein
MTVKLALLPARRRALFALGASVLAPASGWAQTAPAKVWHIGILSPNSAVFMADRVDALRSALRRLGYVEGRNLVLDYRSGEGQEERLREQAADLVRQNVDLIVASGLAPFVLKRLTDSIPIVCPDAADLVALGLVDSLAHPGGNITGQTIFISEIGAKRIEFLKEVIPSLTEVGLLNVRSKVIDTRPKTMPAAAAKLNLRSVVFTVEPDEKVFQDSFSDMARQHVRALTFVDYPSLTQGAKAIADLALRHRIAAAGAPLFADVGGLIGYGVRYQDLWPSAAVFIDKILKGIKPAEIPIEQVTKFEFVLNLHTAKLIGVQIPRSIRIRADRVIE